MKELELRAAATCGVCGNKIGAARLPLFWRVRIERWGIKQDAVVRQSGLEMMVGNVALAQALSPDEDLAVPVMDPVTLTVCELCALEPAVLAELAFREAPTNPEGT